MFVRRIARSLIAGLALVSSAAPAVAPIAHAQDMPSTIVIGINLPFTGADAADAANIGDGAMMAIDPVDGLDEGRKETLALCVCLRRFVGVVGPSVDLLTHSLFRR